LTMKIFSKFKLPYISWIPLFSLCPKHGRLAGHVYKCNTCGGEAYPMTRVVGYLRPVSTFHKGKQAEFRKRKYVSTEEFGCDSK